MRLGIDLFRISRMKKLMENEDAIRKIFNPSEISDNVETLAGRLAAKEAYFKALGKKEDWLSIEVKKDKRGMPKIITEEKKKIQVSITHEGDYAAAVVIIE